MESITTINGNRRPITRDLPKLLIMAKNINDVALDRVEENTGLRFEKGGAWYEAQPTASHQITALLMTWNLKTQYQDNATIKNTLLLKFDHHVGFDVDSICCECARKNHIHWGDLPNDARLSC